MLSLLNSLFHKLESVSPMVTSFSKLPNSINIYYTIYWYIYLIERDIKVFVAVQRSTMDNATYSKEGGSFYVLGGVTRPQKTRET